MDFKLTESFITQLNLSRVLVLIKLIATEGGGVYAG